MHMVPIDRSNMNHHLVTSRDLTDQLAHEDQRPLPTLDIDISLPTRYDPCSPRSYGCQISPSASHRMLRIPSPKGEGFTDPQNATLNGVAAFGGFVAALCSLYVLVRQTEPSLSVPIVYWDKNIKA